MNFTPVFGHLVDFLFGYSASLITVGNEPGAMIILIVQELQLSFSGILTATFKFCACSELLGPNVPKLIVW